MDIKNISPRALFQRFVATLLVLLALSNTSIGFKNLHLNQLFIFSLLDVILFSILMMLFYVIMLQYLKGQAKIKFSQALLYQLGIYFMSLVSFLLASLIYKQGVYLLLWILIELCVRLTQWLLVPKRRNQHGRRESH